MPIVCILLSHLILNSYETLINQGLRGTSLRHLEKEFKELQNYNQLVKYHWTHLSKGYRDYKFVEFHANYNDGGLCCKFVNYDGSLMEDALSSSTPIGVEEDVYREGFNHIWGMADNPLSILDLLPWQDIFATAVLP